MKNKTTFLFGIYLQLNLKVKKANLLAKFNKIGLKM